MFNLFWRQSVTRISMDPLWFCSLDSDPDSRWLYSNPDPHWFQCGSTILISWVFKFVLFWASDRKKPYLFFGIFNTVAFTNMPCLCLPLFLTRLKTGLIYILVSSFSLPDPSYALLKRIWIWSHWGHSCILASSTSLKFFFSDRNWLVIL